MANVIVLNIKPMSWLTNLRIWLAHYLCPKGWAVTPIPEWKIDPEDVQRQVEAIRAEFVCPKDCMCHRLSFGLGYSHAVDCCAHPGKRMR